MNSIGIVVCYFGKFRKDFKMWLKSCEKNPTIDWMIFSDCKYEGILPNNVKIIPTTLQEIKQLIENKLNMKVWLEEPYKLCDFKVVYGFVFQEYLKKYDYWGYCDFDMLFGDMRKFLNEKVLGKYDKYYHFGHLSIYKNNYENNIRFMKSGEELNYKEVFIKPNVFAFDERPGIYQFYINNNWKMYINYKEYADITKYNSRFKNSRFQNTKIIKNYKFQTFLWENGKLYKIFENDEGKIIYEELIYIHYSGREFESIDSDVFFITNKGFINKENQFIDRETISKLNPYKNKNIEFLEVNFKYNLSRIKRKILKL